MEFVVAALVVVVFSEMDQGFRSLEKKIPFLRFKKLFFNYVHVGVYMYPQGQNTESYPMGRDLQMVVHI